MNGGSYYITVSGQSPIAYGTPNLYEDDLNDIPLYMNTFGDLVISEVGNPFLNASASFVEIYNNSTTQDADFDVFDFYLSTTDDGGTSWTHQLLSGALPAGGTLLVAIDNTAFNTAYGFDADIVSSLDINGIAGIVLTREFDSENSGTLIDQYGETTQGGTGQPWEYVSRKVTRIYGEGPNTTFTLGEWSINNLGFSETQDMTPGSHQADVTFNGAARTTDWRNKGNWDAGYIPDAGHNAIIDGTVVIGDGIEATVNDLTVSATRAGTLDITANSFGGYGSIITYGAVTGNASIQKYLSQDRWHYVAIPTTAALAQVFFDCYLRAYDAAAGAWFPYIVPQATPLTVMTGYAVWVSSTNPPVGDTTTKYTGVLNTGDLSTTLGSTAAGGDDDWNVIGNSFPSGIDWDAFTKTNLAQNAFHLWNGTTYVTYSGGSGGSSRFIAPQQGFVVKALQGGGNFTIPNSARVHTNVPPVKSQQAFSDRLVLTLNYGTFEDETVIYFNENATAGNDYDYDADKFFAAPIESDALSQIYTVAQGDERAINTFNNMLETPSVATGIRVGQEGVFSISASDIETFDAGTPIYLEDLKEGIIINLREQNTYQFNASPDDNELRFVVHFADITGITDPVNEDVNAVYAYNNDVYVDFTGERGEIVVYNVVGQEVYRAVAERGLNKFTLTSGSGNYIVKVIGDNTMVSEKVFIR